MSDTDEYVLLNKYNWIIFCSFLPHSAKLKSNKEVCLNPETKWLQQYIEKALEK